MPARGVLAIWTLLVAALTLIPGPGRAEDPFQVTYTLERGGSGPVRVAGRVVNEGSLDVFDVYVTAEALDGGGRVLGRGIVSVGAASFRVRVSSFRQGVGLQAS
jgi:hypothetical protein